VFAETRI